MKIYPMSSLPTNFRYNIKVSPIVFTITGGVWLDSVDIYGKVSYKQDTTVNDLLVDTLILPPRSVPRLALKFANFVTLVDASSMTDTDFRLRALTWVGDVLDDHSHGQMITDINGNSVQVYGSTGCKINASVNAIAHIHGQGSYSTLNTQAYNEAAGTWGHGPSNLVATSSPLNKSIVVSERFDISPTRYMIIYPERVELWTKGYQYSYDNPVMVIRRVLIEFANISESQLDSAAFARAIDQYAGLRCSYVIKEPVLSNKVIDEIARDFGLVVFENDLGQVSIVSLFPPEESEVTTILGTADVVFENGNYTISEEYTSLDYLISKMDIEYGKATEEGKYSKYIESSTLDQRPFAVAQSYLGGVDYSVRLRLVSAFDDTTARECSRIKQLYHFEPTRMLKLPVYQNLGLQIGDWLKLNPLLYPRVTGKIYLVMDLERGKDISNIKLYEFDWDTLALAIQEVPISVNTNYDEEPDTLNEIEEVPNGN